MFFPTLQIFGITRRLENYRNMLLIFNPENLKKMYTKDNNALDDALKKISASDSDIKSNGSSELIQWAIKHNITHLAFSDLLKMLKKNNIKDLPENSKVLLREKEKEIKISKVPPGEYAHFGIEKNLKILISSLREKELLKSTNINMCIFVDNLPLSNFTHRGLWVILGCVEEFTNIIFMIGAYEGYTKPKSSNLFLKEFVGEMKNLYKTGLQLNNVNYNVTVKRVVCDAPAKAFILNIKNYTGFSSCTKCHTVGESINKRTLFPQKSVLRTNKDYEDIQLYQGQKTELMELPNFGIVTDVPLDYMHLVCNGVVKKLVSTWFSENKKFCISDYNDSKITDNLIQFTPKDFSSTPKSLYHFSKWNSSHFRQLLLYSAPVILKYILKEEYYDHFLLLHAACRIFCMVDNNNELFKFGNIILNQFVECLFTLYGKELATHNAHGLYHLAQDCELHGSLDNFSSFEFESFLLKLKNSLQKCRKKSNHHLILKYCSQKIFLRNLDSAKKSETFVYKKLNDPDTKNVSQGFSHYERLIISKTEIIPQKDSEKYVLLKDGNIVEVSSILSKKKNNVKEIYFTGKKFLNVSDYYTKPLKSSFLNIYKVSGLSKIETWNTDSIERKCMRIPLNDQESVIVGLLNDNF